MKVRECMSHHVLVANPRQAIAEAARLMSKCDAGVLPVGEDDRLVGMITDRDIVIRAVADGDFQATVEDVCSDDVVTCTAEMSTADVSALMGEHQIRRIPVVDEDDRLVGIVSLGDLAVKEHRDSRTGDTLETISEGVKRH